MFPSFTVGLAQADRQVLKVKGDLYDLDCKQDVPQVGSIRGELKLVHCFSLSLSLFRAQVPPDRMRMTKEHLHGTMTQTGCV